jgi:shikimate kinase
VRPCVTRPGPAYMAGPLSSTVKRCFDFFLSFPPILLFGLENALFFRPGPNVRTSAGAQDRSMTGAITPVRKRLVIDRSSPALCSKREGRSVLALRVIPSYSDFGVMFGRPYYEVHGACDNRINLYPAARSGLPRCCPCPRVDEPRAARDESPVIDQNCQTLIERCDMHIFLASVSCVGETAIGARLAGLLEFRLFDSDIETKRFFGMSIERLRKRNLTSHGFRLARSQALKHLLSGEDSCNCVIALPPSGLLGALWKVVSETRVATTVVLGIRLFRRIIFYDIDSRPIERNLTDHEKGLYLREIKRDIAYYSRSFRRADVSVDISGCSLDDASCGVWGALKPSRRGTKAMRGTSHCYDACTSLSHTGTNNGAQGR